MRQVTGVVALSNMSSSPKNSVSTRATSGGHSFSATNLRKALAESGAAIVACRKSVLVPVEYLDRTNSQRHLVDVAIRPMAGETVVVSEPVDGAVAVMALDAQCVDTVSGSALYSPLLVGDAVERGVLLWLAKGVMFVRVYDEGLRFAEAMEVSSHADVCYYLEILHRAYGIYNMFARATVEDEWARGIDDVNKLFKERFSDVICEL